MLERIKTMYISYRKWQARAAKLRLPLWAMCILLAFAYFGLLWFMGLILLGSVSLLIGDSLLCSLFFLGLGLLGGIGISRVVLRELHRDLRAYLIERRRGV